jgi:hypothetical protein
MSVETPARTGEHAAAAAFPASELAADASDDASADRAW